MSSIEAAYLQVCVKKTFVLTSNSAGGGVNNCAVLNIKITFVEEWREARLLDYDKAASLDSNTHASI